ncbi:MAG: cardiolipin synthase ClsB [Rhodoferax sp.]|nr:cardiolipin synthase ClsB [Rhodoferax sp.]
MPTLQGGHRVQLLFTGQAFFPALIAAVDGARQEVRLETYIFHDDAVGESVLSALERAALRGVAVYLVVDGIGTPEVPARWQQRLRASGVQWQQFLPLGSLGLLIPGRWRRLHRKLCVVDRELAFCGGINVLDDFVELNHGRQATPRFDFAVQVQGPLVADAWAAMEQFWSRLQATLQLERGQFQQARRALERLVTLPKKSASSRANESAPDTPGLRAGLLLRDNLGNRSSIERAYRQAIARARTEVLIANAYFLPAAKLRRALVHAAQRGVRVRLLLQGKYEFFMQFHAAKPFYAALLDAGVEIYEYQAGFLHAKVAVMDGKWATVGSSNLDPLSLLLAREANVVVDDEGFAQALRAPLLAAMEQHSLRLYKKNVDNRPLWQRLKDRLAYTVMRVTLFLSGNDY